MFLLKNETFFCFMITIKGRTLRARINIKILHFLLKLLSAVTQKENLLQNQIQKDLRAEGLSYLA